MRESPSRWVPQSVTALTHSTGERLETPCPVEEPGRRAVVSCVSPENAPHRRRDHTNLGYPFLITRWTPVYACPRTGILRLTPGAPRNREKQRR